MTKKETPVLGNIVVLADFLKQKKKKQRAETRARHVQLNISCDLTRKTFEKILKIKEKSRELFGMEMDEEDVIFFALHYLLWSCDKKFAGMKILVVKPAKKKHKYRIVHAW